MSPANPGEVTPRRAAKLLGVHPKTVCKWCEHYLAGEFAPIGPVRVTASGRYFIASESVTIAKVRALSNMRRSGR